MGQIVVVKVIFGRGPQKCDGTDDFSRNQQRCSQGGLGMARTKPWIAGYVEVIDEHGTPLLHGLDGNRGIAGTPAGATKRCGVIVVGFGSNEIAVGRTAPEVNATRVKVSASQGAKRSNEVAGFVAVKSSTGKFEEKFMERLLRLRRIGAV